MNISLERKFKRDSHGKCPSNLISMLSTEVSFFFFSFHRNLTRIPSPLLSENLTERWDFFFLISVSGRIGGKILSPLLVFTCQRESNHFWKDSRSPLCAPGIYTLPLGKKSSNITVNVASSLPSLPSLGLACTPIKSFTDNRVHTGWLGNNRSGQTFIRSDGTIVLKSVRIIIKYPDSAVLSRIVLSSFDFPTLFTRGAGRVDGKLKWKLRENWGGSGGLVFLFSK